VIKVNLRHVNSHLFTLVLRYLRTHNSGWYKSSKWSGSPAIRHHQVIFAIKFLSLAKVSSISVPNPKPKTRSCKTYADKTPQKFIN